MRRPRPFESLLLLAAACTPTPSASQEVPLERHLADLPVWHLPIRSCTASGERVRRPDGTAWHVFRVVDARTARPVAGATAWLIHEDSHPVPGRFDAMRTATSDADGFVRVRVDDLDRLDWVAVGGAGYAVSMEHGSWPRTYALVPGFEVPVEVRGFGGVPLAGAVVSLVLGCGHTGDVVRALTDGEGRTVLHGVDNRGICDLFVAHPDSGSADSSACSDWRPGDAAVVLHEPVPGRTVHGIVRAVDGAGEPIAGLAVGSAGDSHRGHWTRTRADGRFVLRGLDPSIDYLSVHDGGRRLRGVEFVPRETVALEVRVDRSDAGGALEDRLEAALEPKLVETSLRVVAAPETAGDDAADVPVPDARVRVWFGDGAGGQLSAFARCGDDGAATLRVPPGRHTVLVEIPSDARRGGESGSTRLDALRTTSLHEVAFAADTTATLEIAEAPQVRIRVRGLPATGANDGIQVGLRGRRGLLRDVTGPVLTGRPVRLEPGPNALEVAVPPGAADAAGRSVRYAFALPAAGVDPVVVDLPPPHAVRGRFVDARTGDGVAGRLLAEGTSADDGGAVVARTARDGLLELALRGESTRVLTFVPDDAATGLRRRSVRIPLPPADRPAEVDLGTLEVRASPQLVLVDGSAGGGHRRRRVELYRGGGLVAAFEPGVDVEPELRPGDRVVVTVRGRDETPHQVPLRRTLDGDGPWRLAFPDGAVGFTVVDEDGARIDARVVFPGLVEDVEIEVGSPGSEVVHAVPAGEHEVVVHAPGRIPVRRRFTLAPGGRAGIRVVLPHQRPDGR